MTVFEVYGPKEIPFTLTNNIKHISKDNTNEFRKTLVKERIDKKQGCYIFCLRAGRGYTPWYVGKATKGIRQECMHETKRNHYNEVLHDGKKRHASNVFYPSPRRREK